MQISGIGGPRLTGMVRRVKVKTRSTVRYRQKSPETQAKSRYQQSKTQKTLGNTRNSLGNTLKKAGRKAHEDERAKKEGNTQARHVNKTRVILMRVTKKGEERKCKIKQEILDKIVWFFLL